ncbi:hypothetical protein WR25_04603 [Diploscapter pachys]|uniref:Uncharacterized protein n=1 Tax=Diploscapter pachys TaxID=2018661 RepID=A0A2A2LL72_9BILA|nr:hypothetical protein WR25_04603 [Diploscapter pachys]
MQGTCSFFSQGGNRNRLSPSSNFSFTLYFSTASSIDPSIMTYEAVHLCTLKDHKPEATKSWNEGPSLMTLLFVTASSALLSSGTIGSEEKQRVAAAVRQQPRSIGRQIRGRNDGFLRLQVLLQRISCDAVKKATCVNHVHAECFSSFSALSLYFR